jgi:hypothetical protein
MSAPHFYSTDRYCMVLSGTWWCNSGADFDPAACVPVQAGSYVRRVALTPHYDGVIRSHNEPVVIAIFGSPGYQPSIRFLFVVSGPASVMTASLHRTHKDGVYQPQIRRRRCFPNSACAASFASSPCACPNGLKAVMRFPVPAGTARLRKQRPFSEGLANG